MGSSACESLNFSDVDSLWFFFPKPKDLQVFYFSTYNTPMSIDSENDVKTVSSHDINHREWYIHLRGLE